MTHSWEKYRTDGQTDKWFYGTLHRTGVQQVYKQWNKKKSPVVLEYVRLFNLIGIVYCYLERDNGEV